MNITLPRATVEQALEAMRCAVPTGKITLYEWDKAMAALRAALAQEAEPVEAAAQYSDIVSDGGMDPRNKYDTAPPQRKPLPKHDQHCVDVPGYGLMAVRLVRAVERAHGITGDCNG